MPNYRSAKRGLRASKRNREVNRERKVRVRAARKALLIAMREKKPEDDLKQLYRAFTVEIDKSAQRGTVHRNTASRYKSRFAKAVKKIHADESS